MYYSVTIFNPFTIFRGIGAYSPKYLFIVQFGVFWSTLNFPRTLSKIIYMNILLIINMGTRMREGGQEHSARSPLEKKNISLFGDILLLVLYVGTILQRSSPYGGPFSPCGDLSATVSQYGEPFLCFPPSPQTKIYVSIHEY